MFDRATSFYIAQAFIAIVLYVCGCQSIIEDNAIEPDNKHIDRMEISVRSVSRVLSGVNNYLYSDGHYHVGQGVAVNNGVLVRLFSYGLCERYSISNIESPVLLSSFPLGSYSSSNHSNCAQFYNDKDCGSLLYVSGLRGKCYVERVLDFSSELLQTISLSPLGVLNNTQNLNIICGDDGYLWAFGDSKSIRALCFAKFRRPAIEEGDFILDENDLLDYWIFPDYVYAESVWQGGKVYDGLLYFVFGTQASRRHISLFDTKTHLLVTDIDINGIISEEPEDCELLGMNTLLLSIAGGEGFYIIELEYT